MAKVETKNPEGVPAFKDNMNKAMTKILSKFDDLQLFAGHSLESEGMLAFLECREIDGESIPVQMFIKEVLDEEKF